MTKELDEQLVRQAARNANLVNLDLDENARREALRQAARRMRAIAELPSISDAAEKVMRVAMAQLPLWSEHDTFMRHLAQQIDPAEEESPEVEAFLQLVEGDRDAVVESDVDRLKGTYALRGGRVVRLAGNTVLPYEHGAAGLVRIMDDGAYSVRITRPVGERP